VQQLANGLSFGLFAQFFHVDRLLEDCWQFKSLHKSGT
jgi:hypothetical protein